MRRILHLFDLMFFKIIFSRKKNNDNFNSWDIFSAMHSKIMEVIVGIIPLHFNVLYVNLDIHVKRV